MTINKKLELRSRSQASEFNSPMSIKIQVAGVYMLEYVTQHLHLYIFIFTDSGYNS